MASTPMLTVKQLKETFTFMGEETNFGKPFEEKSHLDHILIKGLKSIFPGKSFRYKGSQPLHWLKVSDEYNLKRGVIFVSQAVVNGVHFAVCGVVSTRTAKADEEMLLLLGILEKQKFTTYRYFTPFLVGTEENGEYKWDYKPETITDTLHEMHNELLAHNAKNPKNQKSSHPISGNQSETFGNGCNIQKSPPNVQPSDDMDEGGDGDLGVDEIIPPPKKKSREKSYAEGAQGPVQQLQPDEENEKLKKKKLQSWLKRTTN